MGSGALVGGGVALDNAGVGGLGMEAEVGRRGTLVGNGVACPNPSHPIRHNENSNNITGKRICEAHIWQLSTDCEDFADFPLVQLTNFAQVRGLVSEGLNLLSRNF